MRYVGAAIAALSCLLQPAQASQFYGLLVPEILRFSMGGEHARVVVAVPGPTACQTGNRYAYQNEGAGLSWTDMLIEAKLHNNVVLIVGTGECDAYGVEGIRYLSVPVP